VSVNSLLGSLAPHSRVCDTSHMATNLAIDDRLLEEARRIGGHRKKRATVIEALSEYIQRRKRHLQRYHESGTGQGRVD